MEAQHVVATLRLVDTLDEQALLESLIEATKPTIPPDCAGLHPLLATPFRYGRYPHGSRFRRAGRTPGVFYAAEAQATAVAEMAFYRLLFFAESPATPWPVGAAEYTGFRVRFAAEAIDLMRPPLAARAAEWRQPTDYSACQALAEAVRHVGAGAIRYASVRDPAGGANIALLACRAFAARRPDRFETWRMRLNAFGVQAIREMPRLGLAFDRAAFAADPRIAALTWER